MQRFTPPEPFGFISPRDALGIFLQSFLLQEIGVLFRGSVPSCRWLLRARWSRSSCGLEFPRRICSAASGFCSLLKLVLIDLVVSLFYGRCSPGFSLLFRGFALFVLRAPCVDPRRYATSSTSPALQVLGSVPRAVLYRFLRRDILQCVFLNHVSSMRSLLFCAWFCFPSCPSCEVMRGLLCPLLRACYASSLRDCLFRACSSLRVLI